jgi:NitT/TauT family transport system substrate-binding protein
MAIIQSRRRFVSNVAVAGAAGFGAFDAIGRGGGRTSLAAEPPPEITTIRMDSGPIVCVAPQFVAEELLHAEGFADVRYEDSDKWSPTQKLARDVVDWTLEYAPAVIADTDGGAQATMVAGVHVGCFELFAHEYIRDVADLKGKTVGVPPAHETPRHLVSIMTSYVGLDPFKDIQWVSDPSVKLMNLFLDRKIDAFLASAPRPQELRARGIGHSLVNSSTDRPWSQYFCCMLTGRTDFVRKYPVATKRVLRAMLKAADLCAAEPESVAHLLVDRGLTLRYDYALQALNELPYKVWRDYDPEDTVRWYALRLNEAGFTKSIPQTVIAEHTDWRFLNELKRELKV